MRDKTTHILNASSNLLGFCFFVLVSIKVFSSTFAAFVYEMVAITILVLAVSCFYSFLSIRDNNGSSDRHERYAEYLFFLALILVVAVSAILVFDHLTN